MCTDLFLFLQRWAAQGEQCRSSGSPHCLCSGPELRAARLSCPPAPCSWKVVDGGSLWGYVMIDLVETGLMKAWNQLSLRTAQAAMREMLSLLLGIYAFVRLGSI